MAADHFVQTGTFPRNSCSSFLTLSVHLPIRSRNCEATNSLILRSNWRMIHKISSLSRSSTGIGGLSARSFLDKALPHGDRSRSNLYHVPGQARCFLKRRVFPTKSRPMETKDCQNSQSSSCPPPPRKTGPIQSSQVLDHSK